MLNMHSSYGCLVCKFTVVKLIKLNSNILLPTLYAWVLLPFIFTLSTYELYLSLKFVWFTNSLMELLSKK